MTSHILHGLWLKQSGLHLWVEQVEGHKIVSGADVPSGVFPPAVESAIKGKRFAHRVDMVLMTPKGREVRLPVPTVAVAPEQAVQILAVVAGVDEVSASRAQRASLGADLVWLGHMFAGLREFISAGRVVVKLSYSDRKWFPMWQLAAGLGERGWIAQMMQAAPGVLVRNGGLSVAEDIAEELPHWIANLLLRDLFDSGRPTPWHEFSEALLASKPLRRGSANLVSALNRWRDSITAVDVQLVFVVEEPGSADDVEVGAQDCVWPVRVRVRSGVDAPIPVNVGLFDRATVNRLTALRREAVFVSRLLDSSRELPATHPARVSPMMGLVSRGSSVGEWDVYLSTDELVAFISEDVPRLRDCGFTVLLPKAWSKQDTKARLHVQESNETVGRPKVGLEQIVDFDWRVSIGDVELSDKEMNDLVASKSGLINLRGDWVMADNAAIRSIVQYMDELVKSSKSHVKQQIETLKMRMELAAARGEDTAQLAAAIEQLEQNLAAADASAGQMTVAELRELSMRSAIDEIVEYHGSQWHVGLIGGRIQDLPAPQRVDIPDTVHAGLREYQRRGVDWLHWMYRQGLGAVLADDMGLGKTLQLLSLEAVDRAAGLASGPSLVVVPTSVVGNWAREAGRFVPQLRVQVHHGPNRKKGEAFLTQIEDCDIVITSFGTVSRDVALLSQVTWHRVTIDEAQHIKNSSTKISRAVRALPASHRIALTGTPVENRLLELRAILDFCNPGILGSVSFFKNHFSKAIEVTGDEVKTEQLRNLTAPFILRRLKSDPSVIADLPDKTETVITVDMTTEQAALYKAFVSDLQTKLTQARGMGRKGLVLASLTKIKQICNHPAHFLNDGSSVTVKNRHRSGKVAELMDLIAIARENDEKVLIFTQYKAFGDLLVPYLSDYYGVSIPFLHGGVSQSRRDAMVADFQSESGPPAMVLSLKAGGTGLNLTAASMVIHMDRWWNPAVENQATDRAYRIGQDKNVFVYKIITAGTLEERIEEIIAGKTELASTMVTQGEGWLTELSDDELATLLSYREME